VIEDYKIAIGHAWTIRQAMMELDKKRIWPYHLPETVATDEQIFKAEQHLGHLIDPRYKAFLKCANGWLAFYQTVDLFGTQDLISGPRKENGEFILSFLDDGVLKKAMSRGKICFPLPQPALTEIYLS
jgi:hypothetical protein